MNPQVKNILRSCLPKTVKPHRILTGPLKEMRMVTSWHDYPAGITGRTEPQLLNWFSRNVRAGDTWLDIGAHYGYTSLALCRLVGPSGRVFSFEPHMASAGHLCETKRLNGLCQMRVIPLALANCRWLRADRMAAVRGMLDSLLESGERTELYFEAALDWLWPVISEGNARIDGIKIDVQGFELSVLEGMTKSLEEWRPKLALEFHRGVSRDEILRLLENSGYHLPGVAIEPVTGETQEPQYLDDRSYAFDPVSSAREEHNLSYKTARI